MKLNDEILFAIDPIRDGGWSPWSAPPALHPPALRSYSPFGLASRSLIYDVPI